MNLRHLRCFIAVAEELHFGRAARRLHIEQSPLSRTIRKLEMNLGVTLLRRTPRGASLTWAGQVFLKDARRVMLTVEQAVARARAAASGFQGTLRIALSGDIGRTRLSALLALCREEAPQVNIRLSEVPLAQLVHGLNADLFDAGFAMVDEVEEGIVAKPVWDDFLVVALPARHPLLAFKEVPLDEVLSYPLVLCDPQACEGCSRQRDRLFRSVEVQPTVAEYVATHGLMMTLVAAGYGVGFSSAAHLAAYQQADVIARPLADRTATLTTYLLWPDGHVMEALQQFIDRAEGVVRVGPQTESGYARGHYRDLLASFSGSQLLTGRHGAAEVGYIDPTMLTGERDERLILLAGRSWRVTDVDWSKRIVWLEPAASGGKARWMGGARSLGREVCQGIRTVLANGASPTITLSRRARTALETLAEEIAMSSGTNFVMSRFEGAPAQTWTFAGTRANRTLARQASIGTAKVRFDSLSVQAPLSLLAGPDRAPRSFTEDEVDEFGESIKFARCLPRELLPRMIWARNFESVW